MQINQDAHFAALDNMLAEAREIAGSGAARVDACGNGAVAREGIRIDPERGAAPVHMRM